MARRSPPARRPAQLTGGCMFGSCADCMACFEGGDGPPSPCVKVCVIDDASGWCRGCGRTGEEIAGWLALGADAKRDLLLRLPARLDDLAAQGRKLEPAG